MKQLFSHPNCSTCKKAIKWLDEHEVEYELFDIREVQPTKEQFKALLTKNGYTVRNLFNTSGGQYRKLGLKDQLEQLTEEEIFDFLTTQGMLVKRPVLMDGEVGTAGFKEEIYEKVWGKK